jgi:hypothetical protein
VYGNNSNVKFVICAQAVSVWTAQQIFNNNPGLTGVVSIIAIGPYYDCDSIGNSSNSGKFASIGTVDAIIDQCNNSLSTLDKMLSDYKAFASSKNLILTSY